MVLVSSHKHESAALRDAAAFEGATGFESAVAVAEVGETGIWYRVAVAGGFPTLTGAREILDTVKEFGYEGAWIERVATDQ